VRNGNVLAARAALLIVLAASKACWWVMEQPSSSVMEDLPIMQYIWGLLGCYKHKMAMADYGAPTLKKTHLYSRSWVDM